jgi:hypothetical protein
MLALTMDFRHTFLMYIYVDLHAHIFLRIGMLTFTIIRTLRLSCLHFYNLYLHMHVFREIKIYSGPSNIEFRNNGVSGNIFIR